MIYVFGECVLDAQRYELRRSGRVIRLRRKVFQVLTYLLAHHERIVSKDELYEQVWPQQFVSEAALENTVKAVRQAIGDSGREQWLIQTVYGVGYRFSAPVEERADTPAGLAGEALLSPSDRAPMPHRGTPGEAPPPAMQGVEAGADARCGRDTAGEESRPQESTPLRDPIPSLGEWKVVTVLCCTLAESPAASDLPESDVRYRQLRDLYAMARSVVQEYGGTLQPLVADQVITVFGAPVAQEDHAQRAVLAGLALRQRVTEQEATHEPPLGETLRMRLGLHTGAVTVGALGDMPALTAVVVGETVTSAIALQAHAAPGTILCSETTARLVQGVVHVAAMGRVSAAGQPLPLSAYMVLGRRGRRRPMVVQERRGLTPFVGRRRELQTLQALCREAETGHGQVVGIMGEPGMGKSRLVYEFHLGLSGRPHTYLSADCFHHGTATPYWPILALLRHNCGLRERDDPATISTKVRASLSEVGLAPDETAPYLLQLFGVSAGTERLAVLTRQTLRTYTIAALVQMALQGARQRPLVLEIENLHWIDPSSEEVLAALVEQLVGARILLLLTYRPGYHPPWLDKSYATQMALRQLEPRQSRRVVYAIAHSAAVPETVVQTILARAGGNPFFLEELARMLVEQSTTHPPEGLPTTIESVLTARIDRLSPEAKHVLQVAAVIGKDSAVPLLQAIAEVPDAAFQRGLAHLQTAELIYETARGADHVLTFKHALIQEAAYHSLLKHTRQQVHQRIARVLEARFPTTVEAQPELLAHHYTEAGLLEQAIPYWQQASQRALERSANLEAIGYLRKGLDILKLLTVTPEHTQQELALLTSMGAPLVMVKGYAAPEVRAVYRRARELCQQVGGTPLLSPVLWGLWMFYFVRGELETGRTLGEQLLHLAQRAQDPALLLEAHMALGVICMRLGEVPSARAHLEQSIALYQPLQHGALAFRSGQDPGIACLSEASYALWVGGYPSQAQQRSHEALTLAQERAHPFSLAFALSFAAMVHQHRREVQQTQERAEAAVTLATAQGFPLWVGIGTVLRGWALTMQGQQEEGIAQMRQGLGVWQATGAELTRPYCLALLAEAYEAGQQAAAGLHVIDEAWSVIRQTGERCCEAELYRLRGALLLARFADEQVEGERCFRQALALARQQQAKSWELRAAISLSHLWQRQGKGAEARALLASIYGWFTEGFDTADLQEAKALLEMLGT